MNILLDTHTLIWYTEENLLLSALSVALINNPINNVYVSIVSFYEIAIKLNIGKLKTENTINFFFVEVLKKKIAVLPITQNCLSKYVSLPLFTDHKDPFDKLIIATAMEEHLTVITTDKKFILYNELVDIIW